MAISTHAPLAGRDLPTDCCTIQQDQISTHAPLAGRDGVMLGRTRHVTAYFNPRAPCGARP